MYDIEALNEDNVSYPAATQEMELSFNGISQGTKINVLPHLQSGHYRDIGSEGRAFNIKFSSEGRGGGGRVP